MGLSQQIGAYTDCYEYLDQALEAENGIRVRVNGDYGQAVQMSMRFQQARVLHRNQNKKLYEAGHPMHGNSIYDALIIKRAVEDEVGRWWIYIVPHKTSADIVEVL